MPGAHAAHSAEGPHRADPGHHGNARAPPCGSGRACPAEPQGDGGEAGEGGEVAGCDDGVDESCANMKQNMLMKLRSSKVPVEALELLETSEDAPVTPLFRTLVFSRHRRGTCVWQVLRWAAALGAQGVAEVSVFTQAIDSHQRRIPETILEHALKIFSDKNVEVKTQVVVGDPKEKICEVTPNSRSICSSWGVVLLVLSRGMRLYRQISLDL
ncbi:hypothetical protein ZWY2020_001283 [Hordeum vulgare]|nr:hypothetical protein ZWY2020_001283 [Hordeum vulgare]